MPFLRGLSSAKGRIKGFTKTKGPKPKLRALPETGADVG